MDDLLYNWAESSSSSIDTKNPFQSSLLVSSFFHTEQHDSFLQSVISNLGNHITNIIYNY